MRFMNRFAKTAVFTLCASLMSSFAWAGAFDLPSDGKILTGAAEQTYINQRMHDLLSGKVKITFSVTDGWEKHMLKAGEANLERYDYPAAKTNRVLLQLHGGAYVQKLDDLYRITACGDGSIDVKGQGLRGAGRLDFKSFSGFGLLELDIGALVRNAWRELIERATLQG